jgi:biopolymer transport protein ExbB
MFDFVMRGGYVMVVIIACSFIAVAVALQRWRFYQAVEKREMAFAASLTGAAAGNRPLGDTTSVLGRLWSILVAKCTGAGEDAATVIEAFLLDESLHLERYLYILATIATISPLLGLLGTVFGMIKTFHAAAASGVTNPQLLAEGIAEALYNTAAGLMVTIFCVVSHNHLRTRADRLIQLLEARSLELKALLAGGGGGNGA